VPAHQLCSTILQQDKNFKEFFIFILPPGNKGAGQMLDKMELERTKRDKN
jgi:hypothetical protein